MKESKTSLGMPVIDPDDIGHNQSTSQSLTELVAVRMSRRRLLGFGLASGGMALLGACGGSDGGGEPGGGDGGPDDPDPTPQVRLGFEAVPRHLDDLVAIPAGYTATVLFRLGDPMAAGVPAYLNDGTDDPATYDRRAGDHHDGMSFFGMGADGKWSPTAADRGLLVMNHEAITPVFLHPTGQSTEGSGVDQVRTDADEVLREFYIHGVSVIEVARTDGKWTYRQDSGFNRRVHTLTEMEFAGPAAGTDYLKTKYSPDGTRTRGTLNNCANGVTPWGTYLTCEENWAGYFRRVASTDDSQRSARELASFRRYGVSGNGRELWATMSPDTADDLYGRWNTEVRGASMTDDYRNGAFTYGWVVEIDPFRPDSTPRKRTALGRFGHEGACLGPVVAGQPLVWYMGDDARNEYLFKFVSAANWDPADATGGLAAGDKYMDDGTLYVARFDDSGTGEWIELRYGVNGIDASNADYPFADQADVVINPRLAADVVGATRMDRPEWTSINPKNGDVYLTLTNTNASSRPIDATDAANPRFYNDPKGAAQTAQRGNPNGHIVRLAEAGRNGAALGFEWDVYLFGARSSAPADVNLSELSDDNDFSSPDGLWFSEATPGLLWLETDDGAYTDVTNCMLLAALPGEVGDGGRRTITNVDGDTVRMQETIVGKAPGAEGLRRFLVGPKGCEITGIAESGDGRALFVNIQHPGEDTDEEDIGDPSKYQSHWPDGGNARPRSATLVITRDDGGLVGL